MCGEVRVASSTDALWRVADPRNALCYGGYGGYTPLLRRGEGRGGVAWPLGVGRGARGGADTALALSPFLSATQLQQLQCSQEPWDPRSVFWKKICECKMISNVYTRRGGGADHCTSMLAE